MFPKAYQITFNCLTDVLRCFHAGSALGNASRQSRTYRHENTVLVWFEVTRYFIAQYANRAARRRMAGPSVVISSSEITLRTRGETCEPEHT
jgi:hypothetical protein